MKTDRLLSSLALALGIAAATKPAADPELTRVPPKAPKKSSFAEQRIRDKQRKLERRTRRR